MRILHVVEALGGGVLTAVSDYMHSTPEHEHTVLSASREQHATGEGLTQARAILPLPRSPLAAVRAVQRAVKHVRPHIVHAHSSMAGAYVRLAPISGVALAYTPHCYAFEGQTGPKARAYRSAERLLARRQAAVIAVSPREAHLAGVLCPETPAFVVPNTARLSLRRRYTVSDRTGVLRVVVVGRISAQKAPEFLVDVLTAAARLPQGPQLEVTWVGGGPDACEDALRDTGVFVTGWLDRVDVLERMLTTDVYLHTAAWEGSPVSLVEAAALGVPIVCREIPATASLQAPNLAESAIGVARALAGMADPTERARESRRSLHFFESFTPERQAHALRDTYQRVASMGAPSGTLLSNTQVASHTQGL